MTEIDILTIQGTADWYVNEAKNLLTGIGHSGGKYSIIYNDVV